MLEKPRRLLRPCGSHRKVDQSSFRECIYPPNLAKAIDEDPNAEDTRSDVPGTLTLRSLQLDARNEYEERGGPSYLDMQASPEEYKV